eukprot:366070-Chlamydomonas_euryale.AAC.17
MDRELAAMASSLSMQVEKINIAAIQILGSKYLDAMAQGAHFYDLQRHLPPCVRNLTLHACMNPSMATTHHMHPNPGDISPRNAMLLLGFKEENKKFKAAAAEAHQAAGPPHEMQQRYFMHMPMHAQAYACAC